MKRNTKTLVYVLFLLVIAYFVNSEKLRVNNAKNLENKVEATEKEGKAETLKNEKLVPKLIQKKVTVNKEQVKKQDSSSSSETNSPSNTSTNTSNSNSTTPPPRNNSTATYQSKSKNDDEKYFYARNIKCTMQNCMPPYGSCTDNHTCKCLDGYANFTPEGQEPSTRYCTYAQKKQLVAFLLEFFLPFGTGHFYIGQVLVGVLKVLIWFAPFVITMLMTCAVLSKDTSTLTGLIVTVLVCGFICTGLIWQLVDIIIFAVNGFKDGNGVPLQHW